MKKIKKALKILLVFIIIGLIIVLIINSIKFVKDANNKTIDYKLDKKDNIDNINSNSTNNDIKKDNTTPVSNNSENTKSNNSNNKSNTTNTNNQKENTSKDSNVKIKYETTQPIIDNKCSDGSSPDSSGYCNEIISTEAIIGYYCENGEIEDDRCNINGNYVDAQIVITCPTYAYELIDDTCYMHQRKKATLSMSCPEGYNLGNTPDDKNIMTCVKIIY